MYSLPVALDDSKITDYFDIHFYCDETDSEEKMFGEVMPSGIANLMDNARNQLMENDESVLTVTKNAIGKNNFDLNALTPREKEILELSAFGLPIKQIASKLDKSERTVEKHRANIMQKTGTNSIIEAMFVINNHSSKSIKQLKIS